jgi:NAD-dependent oxidoreductase involved in siderophore biosynthesis
MATQNHTVTNHPCALNVVDLITLNRKKGKKHQLNAHYAEAIILLTTKIANIIVT